MPRASLREAVLSNTIHALRDMRIRNSLSMNKLAERSGIHVSTISLMERGLRSPTLDVLLRISEALKTDLWAVLKEATESAKSGKR
ncbi:MAG: helix-turn-helix transcriptional regulator [Chthoniobacteraceae bacterium]|nr:helix-turn-helix transcriptional regulator [Chthoniobacteraceae bacterium]